MQHFIAMALQPMLDRQAALQEEIRQLQEQMVSMQALQQSAAPMKPPRKRKRVDRDPVLAAAKKVKTDAEIHRIVMAMPLFCAQLAAFLIMQPEHRSDEENQFLFDAAALLAARGIELRLPAGPNEMLPYNRLCFFFRLFPDYNCRCSRVGGGFFSPFFLARDQGSGAFLKQDSPALTDVQRSLLVPDTVFSYLHNVETDIRIAAFVKTNPNATVALLRGQAEKDAAAYATDMGIENPTLRQMHVAQRLFWCFGVVHVN